MNSVTLARAGMVVFAICVLGGCSGSNLPDLGTVQGVVTLDGKPYPNARVAFSPAKGRPSEGITDASGRYELTYMPEVRGAEVGDHTVTINTLHESPENPDDARPFKDPIPRKYNESTTLKVNVKDGENTHDFPLVTR